MKTSNGAFVRISVDEALTIISDKLDNIKHQYGSQSLLWYRGSGMSGLTNDIGSEFWKAFGGTTLTYGNLCWPAGLEAVRLTLGSVKHNVPWDLENARTIIIWGKNPAETNVQEISFIARAREKGCRIIVIDPVRTPTSDKADVHISPFPGTDAALALAIAGILIRDEMIDRDFISSHVLGFDEFKNSLHISASEAQEITGIPAENIVELAHIIGKEGPLTILPGYGLQRHLNGGQTIRSILSLVILTGNLGKPGTGFNYANLQSYVFDNLKEPLSYYPDEKNDYPFRRTVSMAKLGADMLCAHNPLLKAIWIERGNPILQSPDSFMVRQAFSKLDFIVSVEQFMTDTAKMADIILPAKDMFEQSDIVSSYWSPYIQFKPKVIQSPGDVLPESEIYYYLAEKLKLDLSSDCIPEPGNQNIEKWLEKRIQGYTSLTLDDLKKGPVLTPGLEQIAWENRKFDTPSGKIELLSAEASSLWKVSPLPDYVPVSSGYKENIYPLIFLTPNTGSRIHSQFGNLKIIRDTVDGLALSISPADAHKRNISSGDRLRIFNMNGEIFSLANVSNRVPEGLIVLPNGIWLNEGGGGNNLISGRETDMGFGAAFHDNMVEVEKVYKP